MSDQLHAIITSTQDLLQRWSAMVADVHASGADDTTEWDWPPLLVLDDGSDSPIQNKTLSIEEFMSSPTSKNMLFEVVLPELIASQGIQRVVFAATAWTARVDADDTKYEGMPVSKRPDRREVVFLLAVEPDAVVGLVAEITRSVDHAPTLGPWETPAVETGDGPEWGGALLDPVREALIAAHEKGGDAYDSK